MKIFFNVSDLNFLDDGENDSLSFIPTTAIKNKFSDKDLLRRIFTENIAVVPEPPTYSEVIQKLIDANAQTVDDVAKILSLYNPDDISAIIQKLIDTSPQPTTAEQIAKNPNILAYPYQANSVIYDYKYLNWTKLGKGNTQKNDSEYMFQECGTQLTDILPSTSSNIRIDFTVKPTINVTKTFLILYTTLTTTSNTQPVYAVGYNHSTKKYTMSRRSKTNGTTTTADNNYAKNSFTYNEEANLSLLKYTDGSMALFDGSGSYLARMDSTSTFIPRSIRINFSMTNTDTTSETVTIKNLQITNGTTLISSWKKI